MAWHHQQGPIVARRKRKAAGFSLIELLIVVAIILTIAAIALPNFMRARITANEAAAVANLRNITTANVVYSTTYNLGYAAQFVYLGGPAGAPTSTNSQLLDVILTSGAKNGYSFAYVSGPVNAVGMIDSYTVTVSPLVPGNTGQRYFFMDESGVIRHNSTTPATVADSPIQ